MKITVEGQTDVKLFPEDDEPANILNIKRGIVSALIVPVMEEEKNNKMVALPLSLLYCLIFFSIYSRSIEARVRSMIQIVVAKINKLLNE